MDLGPHPSEFAVVTAVEAGRTVVTVRGDIDLATVPALRAALVRAEARHQGALATEPFVLDLAGVTFLDASGLGVLVGAARRAGRRGSDIVLRRPSRMTLRVLAITRLLSAFELDCGHRSAAAHPARADVVAACDVA